MPQTRPRVALLVTCLVDLYRPNVGFSAIKLLEEAGCQVEVPPAQTCCGQPAYNSGDRAGARDLARAVIEEFLPYDYTVVPSGSCGGMVSHHYPGLFADDPQLRAKADALAAKTFELIAFLTDVMGMERVSARLDGVATYHDSCAGLRELGVKAQPRRLLASVRGLTLKEMRDPENGSSPVAHSQCCFWPSSPLSKISIRCVRRSQASAPSKSLSDRQRASMQRATLS